MWWARRCVRAPGRDDADHAVRTVGGMDEFVTGPLGSPLERVRAARRALDDAKLAFDCAVSEARLSGASLREVAEVAGLSHTGVAKLCRRITATAHTLGVRLEGGRWRRATRSVWPLGQRNST